MRITTTDRGVVRWADGGPAILLDLPVQDLTELLLSHPVSWRDRLESAGAVEEVDPAAMTLVSPVGAASSVWGIGLNYWSRARATGRDPEGEPTVFLRSSTTGGVSDAEIVLPDGADQVDFEGEMALVIGRDAFRVSEADAWDAVAFVAPANDVTARDVLRRTGTPALGKSFPTFGPIGSTLVTPDALPDPDDLEIVTVVNGEERQRDRTSGMVHSVTAMVELISSYVCLRPGDVILTGSPSGTGDEEGRYLAAGDVVEVTLHDLPPVRSRIVERAEEHR